MMEKGVSVLYSKRHIVPQSMIPGESREMGSADSKDPIRNQSYLFDLFPIPSIILSPDSNTILDSNQAFSERTGLSAKDPLPISFLRSIKMVTSNSLETGEPFSSIGVDLPDRTGRQISFEVDGRPILVDEKVCLLLTFRERSTFTRRGAILHLLEEPGKDFSDRKDLDLFFGHLQKGLGTIFPIHFSILSIPSPDGSLKISGISGKDQGDPELLLSQFRSFRWNTPDGLKSAIGKAIATGKIQMETPDIEKESALSDRFQEMGIKTILTLPFGKGEEDLPFGLLTIGLEKNEEADQTFLNDLEILSSAIGDCLNRNSLRSHAFRRSSLFDLAPDGILLVDPRTCQVMESNRTFQKMVGASPDHSSWDLSRILKRSGETLQEILQTARASGFSSTVEPLTRFDGTRFFADLTCTVIHDRNTPYLLLHVRDITADYETKGINALVVEIDRMILKGDPLEKLLSLIVDRLSGLFGFACTLFMLPIEGGEFNLLRIGGESPAISDFILKSFSDLRWNTPPGTRTLVGKAFIEKRPIYVEIDEYDFNWGSPIGDTVRGLGIAAGFAVPIQKGNNQAPWGVLSIVVKKPEELSEKIRDQITNLAGRIEIAFAQFEEHRIEIQKKAIFDEAPDGIFLLDPERLLLLESNKVFFNMLGVSDQKALVGKHIKEFLVSSEQDFSLLSELLVGYSGHSSLFRSRIRRADGTIFTTSTSVSLIPYGDKKALTVHIRDITQEILIEGMNRLWAELDQRILLGDPLDNLISFIVRKIQDLFGFHWTCFVMPQPDGSFRIIEIASNHPGIDEKIRGFLAPHKWNTQPGNRTLLGRALTS
jgi:PAS domain S-box-containing protein